MSRKERSALAKMAGLIATRGYVAAAGFTTSVLWANAFSPDTYGKYQVVIAASAIVASFCLTGLNDSALISAAKNKDGNLTAILRWRLAASFVGALVLCGWGVLRYGTTDGEMTGAFLVSALLFVPLQLQPIWQAFTNGKGKFRLLTAGQVALATAGVTGVGTFVLCGWTSPSMLPWVMFASLGLTAAVGLVLQRGLRMMVDNAERDPAIVIYGHHVTAAMLLGWVFSSDRLIVGEALSSSDVAVLAVALVLPNQVKVFFTAFEQVFLPKMTEAGSVAQAWEYIRPRFARLATAYSLLGVVGFVVLPIVIPAFFSDRYVQAVPYSRWLWLSLCLSSPFTFLASILNSQRDKRFLYIKNLANPAITLTLFLILIPAWGVAGAVVARIINHVLLVFLHVGYFAHAVARSRSRVPGDQASGP